MNNIENDNEEILKTKRISLLEDMVTKMQESIKKNNINGEDKRKVFIYSRIAEFTYYSEVSIRKFLTGMVPKDIGNFVDGILKYGNLLRIDNNYLDNFAKEYTIASSAIILENIKKVNTKNNLISQDMSHIIRTEKLTSFLDTFIKENINMCYISGYKLSGKTMSVLAYVYDLVNLNSDFEYIIWNDINLNDNQQDKVIENVIKIFEGDIISNQLKNELKEEMCVKHLTTSNTIMVIDLGDNKLEKKLIDFLKKILNYTKIILISSTQFEKYEDSLDGICKSFSLNSGIAKDELKEMINLQPKLRPLLNFKEDIVDIIYNLTSGFPFASLYICRKILDENKYGKSLENIIEEYKTHSALQYDVLNEKIIDETWNEISDLAKNILIICASFSYSISLNMIADICEISTNDSKWINALNECYEKEMLNHIFLINPRCKMNNLIRTLILSKLKTYEKFDKENFLNKLAKHYILLSSKIGECYNSLEDMEVLDELDEFNILSESIELLYNNEKYKEYIEISKNLKYYIYVRGYWVVGENSMLVKRIEAAKQTKDINAQLEGVCDYINQMSKQKNEQEANKYIQIASELFKQNKQIIERRILALYNHVQALYLYNCCQEYKKALDLWKENEKKYWNDINEYRKLVNTLWVNKCNYRIEQDFEKLYKFTLKNYEDSIEKKFTRGIIDYQLLLCNILLKQYKEELKSSILNETEKYLKEARFLLDNKSQLDIRNEAEYYRIGTMVNKYKEDYSSMNKSFDNACEMYTKLGSKLDIDMLKKEIAN